MWTSYNNGIYSPSETSVIARCAGYRNSPRGVIFLHGYEASPASNWMTIPGTFAILKALADAGCVVLSAEAGGQSTWGNSSAISAIDGAAEFLESIATGPIILVGQSMGAQNAIVWASRNRHRVECVIGAIPAINIAAMAQPGQPYKSAIDAAHGGLYSPQDPSVDPAVLGSSMVGVRTQLWAGSDDAVCLVDYALEYAGNSGCTINVIQGGHAESTIALIDPAQVVGFALS